MVPSINKRINKLNKQKVEVMQTFNRQLWQSQPSVLGFGGMLSSGSFGCEHIDYRPDTNAFLEGASHKET